ncbi:UNVERIFIED_CONTAM: hypothetical protein Sradi_6550000 [Sesamum radiatum]|uniref:UBN2 domain-containing protein n=1 Tax=Sesamum radiatum TaxID=300843 RepID=A0AAW2JX03_SESRA
MEAYLRDLLLWEAVESDVEVEMLENPTLNHLKVYEEKISRKYRALSNLHAAVDETIFTRIMACKTAKQVWDKLKTKFQGSKETKQMHIFNLRKKFKLLKMKEMENVKEYINRVMKVVNRIRSRGEDLPKKRIVKKVMITLPKKFEAKISSLEDTWDLSQLTLQELANAL